MSDIYGFGLDDPLAVQTFLGGSTSGVFAVGAQRHVWTKPPGARLIAILLVGAGAGGGGGFTGSSGTARGGGGGGAGGGAVRAIFLADMLPDRLFILTPGGGLGGAASTVGQVGGTSWVVMADTVDATLALMRSTQSDASGGNPGLLTAGGAGLGGAAASTTIAPPFGQIAIAHYSTAGGQGNAGGAQTGAAGTVSQGTIPISGGAGGAGVTTTDFAGGAISTSNVVPLVPGGAAGGGDGPNGWTCLKPWHTSGGGGGGSNNTGVGGRGGDGGPGSGGGGGGGGQTGGAGGNGGPGYCMITVLR